MSSSSSCDSNGVSQARRLATDETLSGEKTGCAELGPEIQTFGGVTGTVGGLATHHTEASNDADAPARAQRSASPTARGGEWICRLAYCGTFSISKALSICSRWLLLFGVGLLFPCSRRGRPWGPPEDRAGLGQVPPGQPGHPAPYPPFPVEVMRMKSGLTAGRARGPSLLLTRPWIISVYPF